MSPGASGLRGVSIDLGRPLGASLLFGGLLVAGLAAVAADWADLSAATEERDAKADLLQRGVAASRRAATPPVSAADPFVSAETATLAAAVVDARLRALATASGLSLLSSRAEAKPDDPGSTAASPPASPSASGVGTRLEDQAVVEGSNEALLDLLVALDSGAPAMLVDDVAVEPAATEGGGVGDPQAPRLHVSLTISAYWRPDRPVAR